MRILITGGAGFIGSHLVEHFAGRAEVVVLDDLSSGNLENIKPFPHTFIEGSITDRSAVDRAMAGVEVVFHLAAMVSVPESMGDPRGCVEANVVGLLEVLGSAAAAGVRKVVLASSAAVYGDNPIVPKTEDMVPEPKSPYAITKLDGEFYLEMFRKEGAFETASLRLFNVFGPRQNPGSAYAAAVPIFIHQALAGEDITIFGDGGQTRDFVHVKDVVAALAHVAARSDLHGTFNVGYGRSMTVLELARKITDLAGSGSNIRHAAERPGDVRHSLASVERLLATGFQYASSLDAGLDETIRYFRKLSPAS